MEDELRGPVRVAFDMHYETSEGLNKYCRENGVSKKGLLNKLVRDFLTTQTSGKKKRSK